MSGRRPVFVPSGVCPWCGQPKKGRGRFCKGHWRRWWQFWYGDPPGYCLAVMARDGFRCQLCQRELDWLPQPFLDWLNTKNFPRAPWERLLTSNGYEAKLVKEFWPAWRREQWREVRSRLHIDHIHPVSNGGPHTLANMRTLCKRCNLRRGNRDEQWEPVWVRRDKAKLQRWVANAEVR